MVNTIASFDSIKGSNSVRTQWRDLGIHNYIKIIVLAGLFYFLFHNEISGIIRSWINDSSWSHGFLIPFFSLYFINQHKKEILNVETKPNYLGLFFLLCAIIFYPLNVVQFQYAYLGQMCMIATMGAIVLFMGGWKLIKHTWLPIIFLIFAVPLPTRYYVAFTRPMRYWAASAAGGIMNLVNGLEATVNGAVIDVMYKGQRLDPPLDVAEACSGMRLLMAFLALGVAMAYLHYRPIWQRIVLLASTIPIAILCNIIRVTITGFIYVLISPVYAQGIYHDMLGLLMLPLAFGLYGALAWFMSNLFIEESEQVATKEDIIVRRRN
jgi:exosortase